MLLLLTSMAFAEEPTETVSTKKTNPLRVGLCGGVAHCYISGIEISNPQTITENIGTKASLGLLGAGLGLTYSFSAEEKTYDPYLSVDYIYSWNSAFSAVSAHYGAYWRVSKKIPLFIDYQIGWAIGTEVSALSYSASLLWGF